jgi:hypothetical protein
MRRIPAGTLPASGATRSAVVSSRIVFCLCYRRGIVPKMAEDATLIVLVI